MATLLLSFLGPFHASLDGKSLVPFRSSKVQALLAYLATEETLRPGVSHRREALMELLWPGMPESSSHHNLRQTLYRLRLAIPEVGLQQGEGTVHFLLADRHTVQVHPAAAYHLDVAAFTRLLERAPTRSALKEASALYQGDFLTDLYLPDSSQFEEWAAARRADLRRQMLDALDNLTQIHLEQEEYDQAEAIARRQLEMDNLRESAHRQLMLALSRHGRRRQALSHYETCRQLLQTELGIEPSAKTQALYEAIRAGHVDVKATIAEERGSREEGIYLHSFASRHNLPPQPTPLVGREQELAALDRLIGDATTRLVTILGPGGMGKTRLALAAAERQFETTVTTATAVAPRFANGVYFVSLVPLTSAEQILPTIAASLSFSFREGRALQEQLLDYLRQKQLLLVLDNFEHLLLDGSHPEDDVHSADGARVLANVLQSAPHVQILVTSRERLRLQEEHVYPLHGLEVPPGRETLSPDAAATDASAYPAVRLFLQNARQRRADFDLAATNLIEVAHICRLVEGMPLAIELAAAWVDTLSLANIADEIQRGLDFLATDVRNAPERHHNMRAVFDLTWQRLTAAEREVFTQLSVFRDGFTREAAQAVTVSLASLRLLATLVSKSLLQYDRVKERYQLHELLRQYAADKLAQDPMNEAAIRNRHTAYYCVALQQWAADLKSARQQAALTEMEADIKNAALAWKWAATQGQAVQLNQAMEALFLFYKWRGRFQEGEAVCQLATKSLANEKWATPVSDLPMPPGAGQRLLARLLTWQSVFSVTLGRTELASQLLQQSLTLLDSPALANQDTRPERAFAWQQMGYIAGDRADYEEARRLYGQSLTLYRALGDQWGVADVLSRLGVTVMATGTRDEGRQLVAESLALFQGLGDPRRISRSLLMLGQNARFTGAYDEARQLFAQTLELSKTQGNPWGIATSLEAWGSLALFQGEFEVGAHFLQHSAAIWREIGHQERIMTLLGELGMAHCFCGEFAKAHSVAEEALTFGQDQGVPTSALAYVIAVLSTTNLHVGRYEEACAQAERVLTLADTKHSIAFAQELLGWALLAEGKIAEAYQFLQASVVSYPVVQQRERWAWSLAGLGGAAYSLGKRSEAQQHLYQGLRTAVEIQAFIPLLFLLPVISLLLADAAAGQQERAIELYALVGSHSFVAKSRLFADIAGRHIAAVAATLPPDVVAAAQSRGRTLDWWATAAELLDELPRLGWHV